MKNWAGNLEFHPKSVLSPATTQEAQTLIKEQIQQNKKIRMRGSSHSWTGLIATDETYLHLDNLQGVIHAEPDKNLLTAYGGTKLKLFTEEAHKFNLALPNQGDVDHQSLAGSISTGTHGTGITLQSISNQLHGVKLINGLGDIIELDGEKHADEIKALSVSMGSMGLITEATVKMIPSYKLKVETFAEDMNESLMRYQDRLRNNRHLEMFYFPVGDWSMVKLMNLSDEAPTASNKLGKLSDLVLENWLYEGLNILAGKTDSYKSLDKLMRKFVSQTHKINWSHLAFPTERTVRFMEMEFNLPIEKFEMAFSEIKASIKKHKFQTLFPIEIRFVKGDDLWLSPAYKRDSVYFAVHTYITEDFAPYFAEMQTIFKRHGGRPHWGKWHSLTHDDLEKVYPKWQDFQNMRERFDPQGLWLNPHLRSLFYKTK